MDKMKPKGADYVVQRRVRGTHDFRLDGVRDVLFRAQGCSVLDVGCNRGMAGLDFVHHGATLIHGVDIYEKGIETAREVYADIRSAESRFEVVDLTKGPRALGDLDQDHDITLLLATYHKLKRVMKPEALSELVCHLGKRTKKFFVWRGTSEQFDDNEAEIDALDADLGKVGLERIHTSYISEELGVACIWSRK